MGCANKDSNKLEISFSNDSSAIVVTHIDNGGLYAIEQDRQNGDTAILVSVMETPNENDSLSREIILPGRIEIRKQAVWFFPDKPFQRKKSYRVSTQLNLRIGKTEDMLKSTLNTRLQAYEKTLVR